LSIIDGMTDAVMKLTNAGVNLQDAIRQVAGQNGLTSEFNKLIHNPAALDTTNLNQVTREFKDQASAQAFINTIKDRYDDLKLVQK